MAFVVMGVFMLLVARRYFRNEYTVGLILAYSLVSPHIQIANKKIDSIYIVLIILFLLQIVKNKGKLLLSCTLCKYYTFIFFVYIIYFISWILFNRNNSADMIQIYLGAVKWILYLQLCYQMNSEIDLITLHNEVFKMITIISVINFCFVVIQKTNANLGLSLIGSLQSNASYMYALNRDTINASGFRRCFGIMAYPMNLGMFSALAIAYLAVYNTTRIRMMMLICMNVFTGVLSATKSFFLGIILLFFIFLIFSFYLDGGAKKRTIKYGCVSIIIILFCLVNFDNIYIFFYTRLGPNYARYWGLLRDFSSIFLGRYSANAKDLSYMPSFLKEYWFLGAGPVSITDEAIMDSALYVILHGGGVLLFVIVVAYYAKMLFLTYKYKDKESFTLLLMVLLFGAGFNTWISSEISMWIIYFILANQEKYRLGAK